MKLDSRILEGKKPLDCFDIAKAKQFIGKKGLFGTCILQFKNLDTCPKCVVDELKRIVNFSEDPFVTSGNHAYMYFLPEEWLKEPEEWLKELEKKYRPYTLAEWIGQHTIGDVIRYRCKSQKTELRHLYVGYGYGIGADIKNTTSGTLTLGVASYTLDYLLEDYEIEVNGEWLPFGVLDE